MSKPGITKKVLAKLSQLSLPYPRSKKNKINNVIGDNNNNSNERKHDVFVSFRGDDTGYKLCSDLYRALYQQNIKTFDDYQLKRDEIPSGHLRAIKESKISVVVFSKNYASSKGCLRELAEIMSCKRMYPFSQIVIPVFYRVDPSHVWEQTDSFVKREQFTSQQETWRDALTEASYLPGWGTSLIKSYAELVDRIVKDVLNELPLPYHRLPHHRSKKVVMKVELYDERAKKKAMKTVSTVPGVETIQLNMKDRKLTVVGDINPIDIVSKLRKLCHTDIVSVGPSKEPEKKKKGGDGGGDDGDCGDGGGGDGDVGGGSDDGEGDGDNDGGDKTEGGGGGDGNMDPKIDQPDFRDFRYNGGDENGYPVGQLHSRNYEKSNVCSIISYEVLV